MNTDCSKCGAAEQPLSRAKGSSPMVALFNSAFITTAYRCLQCGHWNNLKRRKGFKEWKASQQ